MNDQTLELQVHQCVKAVAHKSAGGIYRELKTRFPHVPVSVMTEILDKLIKAETA